MATGRSFIHMAQRTHADDPGEATESKFYVPVGIGPSSATSRVERLRERLVDHRLRSGVRVERRTRTDDRDNADEPKFYLPGGVSPSSDTSRLERLWGRLFDHRL